MLAVSKINQFYGGSHTLWDVDLEVPKGDCVCLMGRNGVGKTTLLKVIMGLLPTVSGEIRFGDTKLNGAAPEARARAGIGYVPQGREIFASLTVEENLRIGRGRNGAVGEIPERVLTLFPVLKAMLKRRGAPGGGGGLGPGGQRRGGGGGGAFFGAGSSSSWPWGGRWPSIRSC